MSYCYGFVFSKTGDMIYISHLDLIRLFGRACRRAGLPVALTQGYRPHLKIKLKRALKLGVESMAEEGEMILTEKLAEDDIARRLSGELPAGVEVRGIRLWEEMKK